MRRPPVTKALRAAGFDPTVIVGYVGGARSFAQDLRAFRSMTAPDSAFSHVSVLPMLADGDDEAGAMSGHYFHQDLLVARRVFENAPERHVDVGSRIDGFVAHVASFRQIDVFDIRPISSPVRNISFTQADLMDLSPDLVECTDSVSSLHAIEHFGLGRYSDPLDPLGHERGITSLHRMLRPGGRCYLSVPIGAQHVAFNAHRVFSVAWLTDHLTPRFTLERFSYVDDAGDLYEDIDVAEAAATPDSFGCTYGCGIFELVKASS